MKLSRTIKRLFAVSIIVMFTLAGLVGCSGASPSDTVDKYFKEISKGSSADVTKLITDKMKESGNTKDKESADFLSTEVAKLLEEQVKNIKCDVASEKIDGDKATVNVKVTGPNISSAFTNMIEKMTEQALTMAFSQEVKDEKELEKKINELAETALKEEFKQIKTDERTGDISLVKKDGNWTIDTNEEFLSLVMGKIGTTK